MLRNRYLPLVGPTPASYSISMFGAYVYFELHRTYTFDICCFYQLKYIYILKDAEEIQNFESAHYFSKIYFERCITTYICMLNIVLWAHSFIILLLYMVIFSPFYHIDIISYITDISDIFSWFFLIFPKPSL